MKKLLLLLIADLVGCCVVRAGAVVGATEFTQIANNIELVASYAEHAKQTIYQAQAIEQAIQSFKLQLQNTGKLDGLNWDGATNTLNQLVQTMRQGEGLAYAMTQEDEAFKKLHDDFAQFAAKTPGASDMAGQYKNWSEYNQQIAGKAIAAAGLTREQAEDEAQRINALKSRAQSANGQMQALDAGLALSGEILDQLRVLKQLMTVQIETQARFQQVEETKKAQEADAQRNLTATTKSKEFDLSVPSKTNQPPQK